MPTRVRKQMGRVYTWAKVDVINVAVLFFLLLCPPGEKGEASAFCQATSAPGVGDGPVTTPQRPRRGKECCEAVI